MNDRNGRLTTGESKTKEFTASINKTEFKSAEYERPDSRTTMAMQGETTGPRGAIPRPGQAGAPFFNGTNVTRFIDEFKDLCFEFRLTDKQQLKKLPLYCDPMIGDSIAFSPEYTTEDLDAVYRNLKRDYRKRDRAQMVYNNAYLEKLSNRIKNDESYLEEFVT
ncbi:hypothetical protein KEM52_004975, partial [Ascosphaera acerosa]